MKKIIELPGKPPMTVEITDDSHPQGWHWGAGSPGLLPGLSIMPMVMIGQAIDTTLTVECVDDADADVAAKVVSLMNKRIQKGKRTMWALDRDPGAEYRLGIYFPTEDAVDVFEKGLRKIEGLHMAGVKRVTRLFA